MTVIVVIWGPCTAIQNKIMTSLPVEPLRTTNMSFIPSLAIITADHTRRLSFLATMTMFASEVHPITAITTMVTRKWKFLATMITFASAALPVRITIITTVDSRKWLFLETTNTFELTALTDTMTLEMRRSPFPVTTTTFIFSGQCSLQENKAIRT